MTDPMDTIKRALQWASDHATADFDDAALAALEEVGRGAEDYEELHPASEWHEDIGTVLWWHVPVQEPPYVGSHERMDERDSVGRPTTCAYFQRQGWLTHWSYLPRQPKVTARKGAPK